MASYPAPPFDAITHWGMIGLVALVVPSAAWVFSKGKTLPDSGRALRLSAYAGFMLMVLAVSAALAQSGFLARADLFAPAIAPLTFFVMGVLLVHGLGKGGRRVAAQASMAGLVLLQGFRLPLEFLMLQAAHAGVMPVEFSMRGYNLDVLTGGFALPLAFALWRGWAVPQPLLWAWNLLGMACLLVILFLAAATSPNLALFGRSPEHLSLWVLRFPYVWLPVVLVGIAIYGHVIVTRKLLLLGASPTHMSLPRQSQIPL